MLQAKSRKKQFKKVETIKEISQQTIIAEQDIQTALKALKLVKYYRG